MIKIRKNKGGISLDLIAATAAIAIIAIAVITCTRTGKSIVSRNSDATFYRSNVLTKLTELENMDTVQLYLLDEYEETQNGITYKYKCSKTEYNTIHVDIKAVYKSLNYDFIIEKTDVNEEVNINE